jgi:tripartite-type tricarboxylate transporter receptor subunit TctC
VIKYLGDRKRVMQFCAEPRLHFNSLFLEVPTMNQRRALIQASLASSAILTLGSRLAQAQSIEQVKIFYGFPPGSAGDICARKVGERFANTSYSKLAAIVDNKPGAGGRIALEALKAAPADGSALAMTPFSALSLYPHIYSKMPYDPFKDFTQVGTASMIHHGLAVGPMVPASVKTVKDFLAWAKSNPKDASYGSPAAGSTPHFIGALLGLNAGVDLRHVPYRGSVPGVTDVVGGQIAAMVTPHGDFVPNHKAGKMRIIATSGKSRSPFVPEVATFAEQGFPELTVEEWFGFVAPAKTPANIISAANAAINAAVKDKAVIDALAVVGLIPYGGTVDEMARSQKLELDRWGPLIKKVGFTAES